MRASDPEEIMSFIRRRTMAKHLVKCALKSAVKSMDRRWLVAIGATAAAVTAGATAVTALKLRDRI